MKKIVSFLYLAAMMFCSVQAYAQQVGTIGLGDITYSVAGNPNESKTVLGELNKGIYSALTKTRKFQVMDHAQLLERLKKQNRSLNGYYSKQYSGNAVWQEGLDFILKVNVTQFSLKKNQQANKEIGTGKVSIDFQLFGVADVTYDLKSSVSAEINTPFNSADKNAGNALLKKTVKKSIEHLVDEIISSLFPIQIVKVNEEGVITFNYGEGLLEVGDSVLIYPIEATEIIDDVGKAVGEAVTTLKINATSKKFSLSQVPEDFPEDQVIEKGQKGRLVLSQR